MGLALQELNNPQEAIVCFDKAININHNLVVAHFNRGNALSMMRNFSDAVKSYDSVITLNHRHHVAYNNKANALMALKRFQEAISIYDIAISINANYADAYYNRGNALKEIRDFEAALSSYEKSVFINPNYIEAYCALSTVLKENKKFDEALANCDKAISISPAYAYAHSIKGDLLADLKRWNEALESYKISLQLNPTSADDYYNSGVVLQELNQLDAAHENYERAIAINPNVEKYYNNNGVTLHDLKLLNSALGNYDKAISINKNSAEASFNKALTLLLKGELTEGWKLYEQRWNFGESKSRKRDFSQPLWLGKDDLKDKTILLHCEQGLGDSIQFSRYAEKVSELGGEVILQVQNSLLGLFKTLNGVSSIIDQDVALPDFDFHCPLLSLPLAFNTTIETIPTPGSYLKADTVKINYWIQKLGVKDKPRIGIVWSGNLDHRNDRNRSLGLSELVSYLPDNCMYVSLQKQIRDSDENFLMRNNLIHHYASYLNDFSDTAALCELMDLVISVDTSVAHLSGAMGKKTWVLLPFIPDWRWMLDREDSPWYTSVKLYRQREDRLWAPVLRRVADDLTQILSSSKD